MMMTSGFFRLLSDLPKPFWRYPVSYISYGAWGLQVTPWKNTRGLETFIEEQFLMIDFLFS